MASNRFGLSRTIDAGTKRAVRQHCGFGCVCCGCAVIQYHHFDPPFADAQRHCAAGITLLCGTCHDRAERGIISESAVAASNATPFCKDSGHTKDMLSTSSLSLPVRFGSSRVCAATILKYDNDVIIGFSPPEVPGGPLQLNAVFTDAAGLELLRILNNEWQAGSQRYDIQLSQDRLKINDGPGDIALEMSLAAGSELRITRLHMTYGGFSIIAGDRSFSLITPAGGRFNHTGDVVGEIGLWLKSSGQALIASNATGGAGICLG